MDPGDELVDITDQAGNPIGIATRRQVRAQRLPHRCTYILVFNARGEVLIHRRTATKDIFPDHWDVCVGGVLAAGEDWDEGARRELAEELGVDAPVDRLFPFRYEDEQNLVFAQVYRAEHSGPFRFQPEEVVEGEFVPLGAVEVLARSRPFCPDGLAVWREYLGARGIS